MRPSMKTVRPFFRYSPATSAVRPKALMLCHSVLSCQVPSLSFTDELVASENVAMVMPLGVDFTSGSLPRLPSKITLLTPRAMRTAPVCITECAVESLNKYVVSTPGLKPLEQFERIRRWPKGQHHHPIRQFRDSLRNAKDIRKRRAANGRKSCTTLRK